MSVDLIVQLSNLEQSLAWSRNAENRGEIEASMQRAFKLITRLAPDVEAGIVKTAIKLPSSNKAVKWPVGWETNDGDFLLAEGSLQLPLGHEFLYKYKLVGNQSSCAFRSSLLDYVQAEPPIETAPLSPPVKTASPSQDPVSIAQLRRSPAMENLMAASMSLSDSSSLSSLTYTDDPITPPPDVNSPPTFPDHLGCDPRVFYEHYQETMPRSHRDAAVRLRRRDNMTPEQLADAQEDSSTPTWQKRSSSLPLSPPQPLLQHTQTLRRAKKGVVLRPKKTSNGKLGCCAACSGAPVESV